MDGRLGELRDAPGASFFDVLSLAGIAWPGDEALSDLCERIEVG
jgi:hypothetical protein